MDENHSEAKAIEKLLAGPTPFETPRSPSVAAAFRRDAEALPDGDPTREKLIAESEKLSAQTVSGELWPLTHREHWRVKALLAEAAQIAQDLSPAARQGFLGQMFVAIMAQIVLRKPGTGGKVHVLSHEEAAQMDPATLQAIHFAYVERFMLTEDELPKGPTPR